MKLNYNEKELHQLLQDFHDLTKLTLTLYDPEGEWILSYPTKENCFCHYIKTSPEGAALCDCLLYTSSAGWLTPQMQEEMKKIENCLECGQCMKKCPYELNTPELLKKNYEDYKKVLAGEVSVN